MATKLLIKRIVKISNHVFYLEIYLHLECKGLHNKIVWEIFPSNYQDALYAFSNKEKINKLIEEQYIYEPTNKLNVPRVRLENTN